MLSVKPFLQSFFTLSSPAHRRVYTSCPAFPGPNAGRVHHRSHRGRRWLRQDLFTPPISPISGTEAAQVASGTCRRNRSSSNGLAFARSRPIDFPLLGARCLKPAPPLRHRSLPQRHPARSRQRARVITQLILGESPSPSISSRSRRRVSKTKQSLERRTSRSAQTADIRPSV